MKLKERIRFYHDLSLFSKSGITLERGLNTMKQGKSGSIFWILDTLQDHIGRGGTLWEAMSRFKKKFDSFQLMVIKAAEETGTLTETALDLSRYFEMRLKEIKRLISGLAYPVILLHGIVVLPPLKYLILPSLGESYWGNVLPPLIIAYGMIGLGYFSWKKIFQHTSRRKVIDDFFISIPWIGKLIRDFALVRVLRTLAYLINAGIEPARAARQAIETTGNTSVADDLKNALEILEHGGTYTNFFSFSGALPAIQLGVIAVGEETGTLVESLHRLTNRMEEENAARFTTMIKTAAIMAYIVAAIFVAMTVISFYGGMYSNLP